MPYNYAEERPTDDPRPAYNFSGDLFHPSIINQNLKNLKVVNPDNKWTPKDEKVDNEILNRKWPDDNPQQNPTNKLVNNVGKDNPEYRVDMFRVAPKQVDIIDDDKKFKFSDQLEETPEATRPKKFQDFFN